MSAIAAFASRHSGGSSGTEWTFILIVFGFMIAVGILAAVFAKKRRAAHMQYCIDKGYQYAARGVVPETIGALPVFAQGHTRRVDENIAGTYEGQPFALLDYATVSGHGKHRTTHHRTIVIWTAGGNDLPTFSLTPEGVLARIGHLFGGQDIDFEDDPDFSRTYQLKGDDVAAVRNAFNAERRRALAAQPNQHIAGGYGQVIWWAPGGMPAAVDLDATLAAAAWARRLFE